jgi:hypothetical protein
MNQDELDTKIIEVLGVPKKSRYMNFSEIVAAIQSVTEEELQKAITRLELQGKIISHENIVTRGESRRQRLYRLP